MPVVTVWSVPPIIPDDTTDGVIGPCGATLGRYMQPKPSELMSNSTNDGVIAAPWSRTSRGVVIETRHFTRVSSTGPPLYDVVGDTPDLATAESLGITGFGLFLVGKSTGDGDVSDNDDGCNLSMPAANVRPVNASKTLLASCWSSLSEAQNSGSPSRRKSLSTAMQWHTFAVVWWY